MEQETRNSSCRQWPTNQRIGRETGASCSSSGASSKQARHLGVPVGTNQEPFPVVRTDFDERNGQFSPDGKWIAYESLESGRSEIYVQPFPGPGARVSISVSGGAQAGWRPDGKELFFIALDDRLMAVPIALPSDGGAAEAGTPVPLFTTHVGGAVQSFSRQQYIVSPDGQRFLMNTVMEGAPASPMTVIVNWTPPH